jgi:pimeloyl-ACP methyl ester carboxylesterase
VTRLLRYRHDGLTFDVTDQGPLDGDPVVLLHGFPERATAWRLVAPLLHARGLRTYAPDQRGYSPGARPRRRRDYRIQHLVDDAIALIDTIGRPVHLVGHDWGSIVGWYVAGQRPDLVRSWTAVSVPHPVAFLRAVATTGQFRKSWYMAAFQLPRIPERVGATPRFTRELRKGGMTREDVDRFRTEVLEDGALPGALMWYRALPMVDRRHTRARVSVPTTFVWSDRDVAIGPQGGRLTPRYVDGPYRYVELAGVSHWIPTQAPEALAEAILDRIDSAS